MAAKPANNFLLPVVRSNGNWVISPNIVHCGCQDPLHSGEFDCKVRTILDAKSLLDARSFRAPPHYHMLGSGPISNVPIV